MIKRRMAHFHLAQMKEIIKKRKMKKTDNGKDRKVVCKSIEKRVFQLPSRGLKMTNTCLIIASMTTLKKK